MLCKAFAEVPRSNVQIVTKGGLGKAFKPDGNPKRVRDSIEQSLKRLDTDYLDLFNLARIDTSVPIEETVGELKLMVQEGDCSFYFPLQVCWFSSVTLSFILLV